MADLALVKTGMVTERGITQFLALADATLFGIDMAIRAANGQSGVQ